MMPVQIRPGQAEVHPPLRILLADDNKLLRASIRALLRGLGHSVEAVSNGREAVESAAREEFDVVLLDVQMPEMGGLEAARALRRQAGGHRPRIVGLSAEGVEHGAYSVAGMDAFLVKPIRLADLIGITARRISPP
ncbi:response regulator [Aquisphaera giovannonii]|nr:response regulator [Aquisphaera giovannonii]